MTRETPDHRELMLIDILHSGHDLRAKAIEIESPVLVYLTELVAKRAREELGASAQPLDDGTALALEQPATGPHPIN